MRNRFKCKGAAILLIAAFFLAGREKVLAGELNSVEASVLAAISAEYTVDGDTYRLAGGFYEQAEAYLVQDGVDITAEQAQKAGNYLSNPENIKELADAGYFYKVETAGGTTAFEEETENGKAEAPSAKNAKKQKRETIDPEDVEIFFAILDDATKQISEKTVEEKEKHIEESTKRVEEKEEKLAKERGAKQKENYESALEGRSDEEDIKQKAKSNENTEQMSDSAAEKEMLTGSATETEWATDSVAEGEQMADPTEGYSDFLDSIHQQGVVIKKAASVAVILQLVFIVLLWTTGCFRFQKRRSSKKRAFRKYLRKIAGIFAGAFFAAGLAALAVGGLLGTQIFSERIVLDHMEKEGIIYADYERMLEEVHRILADADLSETLCDEAVGWQRFQSNARTAARSIIEGQLYDGTQESLRDDLKNIFNKKKLKKNDSVSELTEMVASAYEQAVTGSVGSFIRDFRQAIRDAYSIPAALILMQEFLALFLLFGGNRYPHRALRILGRSGLCAAIALVMAGFLQLASGWAGSLSLYPDDVYVFFSAACDMASCLAVAAAIVLGIFSVLLGRLAGQMKARLLED